MAEIAHPDYPGERLIACRNPLLAAERARKRGELLTATETRLAPILTAVTAGRLPAPTRSGSRSAKLIDKYKMAKHLHLAITDTTLTITRNDSTRSTPKPPWTASTSSAPASRHRPPTPPPSSAPTNTSSHVERDFRTLKIDDLDLRPIRHCLEDRVRAHVLLCVLAAYLVWHLRQALAPLTYTDEHPPDRDNPVAPAQRSPDAPPKPPEKPPPTPSCCPHLRGLLAHLATLTRNDLRFAPSGPVVPTLAEATPTQRQAFDLIGTTIPLTLA